MNIIDLAVNWAEDIANDNTHGYSQSVRWGPSYDCSSLVISAYQQAFKKFDLKGPQDYGASYTGNMYSAFKESGFADITSSINLSSGTGLQKGDVLLNHENHTALYIGNGQVVHARSSEGTSDTADNSGNEIRCQGYWNYPWNCILRYGFAEEYDDQDDSGDKDYSGLISDDDLEALDDKPIIPYDSKGYRVAMLQGALRYFGYNLGWFGIDGDSGGRYSYTNLALAHAVEDGCLSIEFINDFMREEAEL